MECARGNPFWDPWYCNWAWELSFDPSFSLILKSNLEFSEVSNSILTNKLNSFPSIYSIFYFGGGSCSLALIDVPAYPICISEFEPGAVKSNFIILIPFEQSSMMVETLTLGRFHHPRLDFKRWIPAILTSHRTLFTFLWIAAFASVFIWQRNVVNGFFITARSSPRPIPKLRPVAFNLTDFGAVGDGLTLNTKAFLRAISVISRLGKKGGGQLNVPPGRWLTAPFNLTSHMTLFLAEDAVILGIQVSSHSLIIYFLNFEIPSLEISHHKLSEICFSIIGCWRIPGKTSNFSEYYALSNIYWLGVPLSFMCNVLFCIFLLMGSLPFSWRY